MATPPTTPYQFEDDQAAQNRLEMDQEIQHAIQMASRRLTSDETPTEVVPLPPIMEPLDQVCTLGGSCGDAPVHWATKQLNRWKEILASPKFRAFVRDSALLFALVLTVSLPQVRAPLLKPLPWGGNHWVSGSLFAAIVVVLFMGLKRIKV